MKPLKPRRSFADQLQLPKDRGLHGVNPAAALMKRVSVQLKTDAYTYTVCRGVGPTDAEDRRCDYPGHAKGPLTGACADGWQVLLERVTKQLPALNNLTDEPIAP
ncbi:MAG: hypothetical protein KF778_01570 [Rhodocyclaceae bacterium]|nr:hypothetical protein [Rhodocyclaceae bacterium]MBX3667064.1 hypothetical protein [Rhodocyclaceae bacterium]